MIVLKTFLLMMNILILMKVYDLPADFLLQQINAWLGSKYNHDVNVLLMPVTVLKLGELSIPTSVSSVVSISGLQDKLFFSLA